MIQQGLPLEEGEGFLIIRVSYGIWAMQEKASGRPLSPDSEFFFGLLWSQSFDCTKYLPFVICHLVRIIKWWLSDQLPLWYFLCISVNGFEGQLCKCNLCVTVYSFVLCRKTFALRSQPAIKASCLFIGKLNTCVSWLVYVFVKIFL